MFDFLFRRAPKTTAAALPVVPLVSPVEPRLAALSIANACLGDEAACVAFVLDCAYADARLVAAEGIHDAASLKLVHDAMRNTDRRVARLMQSRIDILAKQSRGIAEGNACIAAAQLLVAEPLLLPNRVSELERRWQQIDAVPLSLQQHFEQVREQLLDRLAAQATLQREVRDALTTARALTSAAPEIPADPQPAVAQRLIEQLIGFARAPEAVTLPKQLLWQCDEAVSALRKMLLDQQQAAVRNDAARALLTQWEAQPPATLQMDELQKEWDMHVADLSDNVALVARFETLREHVTTHQPIRGTVVAHDTDTDSDTVANSIADNDFQATLQLLEAALDAGQLQAASDADKRLRAQRLAGRSSSAAQSAQIARLRGELARLQSWARWGGNVSREGLQEAAESLPAEDLTIAELAKRVGSLRETWTALDQSAGPAPITLWRGFDAACTLAYAPVAAHFAQVAHQRQQHLLQATQQIAQMRDFAADWLTLETPDWQALSRFCQQSQQTWQRIGPMPQRDRKQIDREFHEVLTALRAPLLAMQTEEITQRELLIEQVDALLANDRHVLDKLRTFQQQWQERAKLHPLSNRDEQSLWVRFRAACDAMFALRKVTAAGAEQERQQNLRLREQLCQLLEQSGTLSASALAVLLKDVARSWSETGPVPRSAEESLQRRYRQAVTTVEGQLTVLRRDASAAILHATQTRLRLCQQYEAAIAGQEPDAPAPPDSAQWVVEWEQLPAATTPLARALQHRFDTAREAVASSQQSYRRLLQANRSVLQDGILRLEIILSLESPPEYSRQRMQLQVDVLQAMLRSGQKLATHQEQLIEICSLPAVTPADLASRLQVIVSAVAA